MRFKTDGEKTYWNRNPNLCPCFFRKYFPYFEFWSLFYRSDAAPLLTPSTFLLWISATHSHQQLTSQLSSHCLSINYLHNSKYIHWRSVPKPWRTAWVPYIFLQYSPLNESDSFWLCQYMGAWKSFHQILLHTISESLLVHFQDCVLDLL